GIAAAWVIASPAATAALGPWTVPAAGLAALLVGALVGLGNGGAVAGIGIPPFIVTLAMMRIARGVAKHVTNGSPIGIVGPDVPQWREINGHWEAIRPLGLGYVGGVVPLSFLIACGVVLLLAL